MAKKGIDYSKIYVADDPITIEVNGVEFKLRELDTETVYDILEKSTVGNNLNKKRYLKELIAAAVVEPKLDVRKLKPSVSAILLSKIESVLGISEEDLEAIKKK